MGKQKMLVNVYEEETRIALTEDGMLVGLHFQQTNRERTAGNIYKGLIVKVNPAFQAAFVDYGEKRNGFLSISDLNPSLFKTDGGRGRSRIQSILRAGQHVMVQVLKEGMREKGAALTTNLSLPGRYLVYTPNSDRSGVSRKIGDQDKRHELKDILAGLVGEEGAGVIIRTAGIDRPATDLKRDLAVLKKEWNGILDRNTKMARPGILHQEPGSIVRVLRDYFSDDVEEVWVDSPEAYQEALGYFKSTLPKFQKRLKLYVGEVSLFAAHNVEEQLEALGSSRVPLASGGGIVIESTEALVSIDVNSGKSNQESDIEDTALRTNLEAAREVARQLRLRNLGGLIVVDFIDMFQAKNRTKVIQALTDALRTDKARTSIGTISQFGLLELSRQRIDMELSLGLRHKCEACSGTGSVPTLQAYANSLLRKIRTLAATHRYTEIHGELPMEHANYMLNQKRESLRDLELEFDLKIHLVGTPALLPAHSVQLTGKAADGSGREVSAVESRSSAPTPSYGSGQPSAQGDGEMGRGRRRRRGRGRGRGGEMGPPLPAELGGPSMGGEAGFDDAEDGHTDKGDGRTSSPSGRQSGDGHRTGSGNGRSGSGFPAHAQPMHADSNGGPQPGRMISPGIPSGNAAGAVQFSSSHIITDPDFVQIADPPRRRAVSPFKAVAAAVEPGSQIFGSAHIGPNGEIVTPGIPMPPIPPPALELDEQQEPEGQQELELDREGGQAFNPSVSDEGHVEDELDDVGSDEASVDGAMPETSSGENAGLGAPKDGARRRRSRGRGRGRGRGGEGRAAGAEGAPAKPSPVAAQRSPGGRGDGRGPRGPARPQRQATARPPVPIVDGEPNGNVIPPEPEEQEEVNGNVLVPERGAAPASRGPSHRRRRVRGRGGRGRPAPPGAVS